MFKISWLNKSLFSFLRAYLNSSLPPSRPSSPPCRTSSPSTWGNTSRSSPWSAAYRSSSWDFPWSQRYGRKRETHTPLEATQMPAAVKIYRGALWIRWQIPACKVKLQPPGGRGSVSGTRRWALLKPWQLWRAKSRMKQDARISFLMISRYKLV